MAYLHLNSSDYIDTMKLNDCNIYKNKDGLYVTKIGPNYLMWRGYNNRTCADLSIPPGSNGDRYRFEPVWYGPPEVTVIYAARNMTNTLLRTYGDFRNTSENLDIDETLRQYYRVLEGNYSSIVAYTTKEYCELIDVNNIENLKKLVKMFDANWSIDKFNLLNSLSRITFRQKLRIYEWLIALDKHDKENMEKNVNIYNDEKFINDYFSDIKKKSIIEKIKLVLENNFRKVFGFGKYVEYDSRKINISERKINKKNDKVVEIKKDLRTEPMGDLQNFGDAKLLRTSVNKIYWENDQYRQIEDNINDIEVIIKEQQKIMDSLLNNTEEQIKTYIKGEEIRMKNDYVKNFMKFIHNSESIKSINLINDIKNKSVDGYTISTLNGGLVILEKIGRNKYKVHFNLKFANKKYNNPSTENPLYKECKLCRLARERNWLNEMYSSNLSHKEGLSINQSYYDYDPIIDQVRITGVAFQNMWSRSIVSESEERVLSIPYVHLGTMDNHTDCNEKSKNFPPHGSYNKKEGRYNCGAYLYSNSRDDEVIYNFMGSYNAALTYAYKKYGRRHRIADINYDRDNGNFYKFKDPSDTAGDPKIYINFHCKVNSEPHIHMHTYIDSKGTNLKETLDTGRYVKDKDKSRLSKISGELFGSNDFSKYKGNRDDLILTGDRKKSENNMKGIKWESKAGWSGKNQEDSTKKLHYPCSFQYLFKKILGIEDGDEKMEHEWIFPEPNYDLQPDLFDQTKMSYANSYHGLKKAIFQYNSHLSNLITNLNKFDKIYIKSPQLPKKEIVNTRTIGLLSVKYGEKDDETAMVRQSTTEGDAIMLLFLQIACINNPNIGGYFGSSAPLMNRWKNITHTETCLFNSVDYPTNVAYDAPYTTCNKTSTNVYENYMKYVVFTMYLTYFRQSQKKYVIKGNSFRKVDLVNQFLNSDAGFHTNNMNQNGGKVMAPLDVDQPKIKLQTEKLQESNGKQQYQNKIKEPNVNNKLKEGDNKSELENGEPADDVYNENVDLFQEEMLDPDITIKDYNASTSDFKLTTDSDIHFAKTIIKAIYHGCVPTANQIDY